MSDWPGWAGVGVSLISLGFSAYATQDARRARNEAKRAREQAAIDRLDNQHQIKRSHWEPWGIETNLAGLRSSIAEWRDLCAQQLDALPKNTERWFLVRDLADAANAFGRATDDIAQHHTGPSGYIPVTGDDNATVAAALQQFQHKTSDVLNKLLKRVEAAG